MQNVKILGLGTPLIDRFANVDDSFLQKFSLTKGSSNYLDDEAMKKIESELKSKIEHQYPGDNARNALEAYSSLGGKFAAYAGKIAKDEAGAIIETNISSKGFASYLQYDNSLSTGRISALITPDKERTFAVYLGAGNEQIDISALPIPKMFFCTSITLFCNAPISNSCLSFARKCKEEGSKVAISLESPRMVEENAGRLKWLLSLADILFLNEDELAACGKSENEIANSCPLVFLKRGSKGSTIFENTKKIADVPAIKIKKVQDTTGAGDAYAGGVLWAILEGKSPKEAANFGTKAASKVIQKIGAGE